MAINPMDAQGGGITQAMPQGMPTGGEADPRRPQGQIGGDLLKALAAQKLLRDKQMAERQLTMAQEADANTVVAKNESELSQRSLNDVTKGVSGVLTKKNADMQKNMKRVASKGIANNPRQNMQRMAQGGIVGFQEGQEVEGGEVDSNVVGKALNWVKENPAKAAEYASLGLMFVPGFGIASLAGRAAFAGATRFAPKLMKGVQALATKPRVATRVNTGQPMGEAAKRLGITDDVTTIGRQFDPNRAALTAGGVGFVGSKMFGGDEETPKEENIVANTEVPTPEVTPPVAAKPAVSDYEQRRTDASRALSIGGIGAFGQNIEAIEGNRAEREIKARANELQAVYNQEILSSRNTNNARSQLLQFNTQLQNLIAADPKVRAAQVKLDTAATKGKEKDIAVAQAELNAARKAANTEIGNTPTGANLIAEILAIKEALGKFRESNSGTGNDGYTIKPKG
tara:strand:+ start:907 stop:2274 length:1368 start_codon:yes stop_codon:yes gene_type:complete